MRLKWSVICLLLVLVFSVSVAAEQNQTKEKPATKTFTINSKHAQLKREANIYTWTGNVRFDYEDIKIQADKLKINKNKQVAHFTGEVHLIRNRPASFAGSAANSQEEIWSNKLNYDYQAEILVAQNKVKLKTTKENKPLTLTSEYLKLWTGSSDLLAKKNVFVNYDQQKIQGERLKHTAAKEKMVVTEEVEIKKETNWIACKRAVLWLEDNLLEAAGSVEMEFEVKE